MSLRQTAGLPPSLALHRYWMHSNRMRQHFEAALQRDPPKVRPVTSQVSKEEIHNVMSEAVKYAADDRGMFMSYWYGSLYVVVEGWKQLKLRDSQIDGLVQSRNVRLLKLYRNGVFHFQRNYFDDRFAQFMKASDSVDWVRKLHSEFGRFFLEEHARRQNVREKTTLN
jgi:hypothetical protein